MNVYISLSSSLTSCNVCQSKTRQNVKNSNDNWKTYSNIWVITDESSQQIIFTSIDADGDYVKINSYISISCITLCRVRLITELRAIDTQTKYP
jgi:acetone carboxylase gamma subunit